MQEVDVLRVLASQLLGLQCTLPLVVDCLE
jgi:hypothetical protein